MRSNFYILKYTFVLLIFTLKINYIRAQIQPWIGLQTFDFRPKNIETGISTGIVFNDKLLFKYSFTKNTFKNDYSGVNYGFEYIYFKHLFSAGWIFTKPYKKIRMGSGFLIMYSYVEKNSYDSSVLTNRKITEGFATIPGLPFIPFPLPFFYMDMKVSNNLKLVFNTSIILNEIGIGYRFGEPPIQLIVEEKIKKTNKKEKVIFH